MQRRQEILNDITDTVGGAFLGLTYGCARCHDHKFDPILQKDYYRLQAFFANTASTTGCSWIAEAKRAEYAGARTPFGKTKTKRHPRRDGRPGSSPTTKPITRTAFASFPRRSRRRSPRPPDKRTPYQWQMYHKAKPQLTFTDEEIAADAEGRRAKKHVCRLEEAARRSSTPSSPLPLHRRRP